MIENFVDLYQINLIFAAWASTFIIAFLLWLWWRKPHPRFPLGPRGIPLLGVLPWLSNYPERVLKKWSKKHYGPVMSARFGMEDVVVLNTYDVVQQALVKQGSHFSGRPRIKLYTQVLGDNGFVFADYDKKFRTQKRFLVNVLKRFGQGKREMEKLINEESDYFVDHMKSLTGKPYHMLGNDFQNLIGNIICRLTFGRRFDYNDPKFRKVFDVLKDTYSDPKDASSIATLIFFYDYVKNLPPFAAVNRKIIQSELDMMAGFLPLIQEHKESFDENQIRDYIDAFIYEQKFGKNPEFSDDQLMIAVRDLFAAGTETSSSTVNWLILALLTYPEHQKKIVEEIDSVFGQKEWPSMSKRNQMPFTCAFIQEVQRYCPAVPLSVTHITQNDVEFAGYSIPKGTKVIPNIWGAHFDVKLWVDPFKFDPYRHIDSENQFIPSKKIIPFGVGPRFCPGESIARMEIFLVLVKILQKFTFTGTGDRLPSLLSGLTTIVYSARRFEVVLHAR